MLCNKTKQNKKTEEEEDKRKRNKTRRGRGRGRNRKKKKKDNDFHINKWSSNWRTAESELGNRSKIHIETTSLQSISIRVNTRITMQLFLDMIVISKCLYIPKLCVWQTVYNSHSVVCAQSFSTKALPS